MHKQSRHKQSRGFMIALEGVDGSGKSGLARSLSAALRDAGHEVLATHEPGGTEAGAALRKILLASNAYDWTPTAELLLMNASRRQHIDQVILPALQAGKIVLCDRFVGSTIAYQGAGRGLSEALILDLHRLTIEDLWPDLTLVLDLDPKVALERSRSRLQQSQIDEGRFEALDLAFHRRVRQSFLDQAAKLPAPYKVVDADRPPELVEREALSQVSEILAERIP
ncbi:dTMP kinase [Bosea vaviloviae]|uniref:Thymidylate kinase n=2 Tax=Bosea vaviloviae TaxID=1526658 RepID=A0A1D7U4U0_9HYPH|nr:dTMP kinase [Bosea vaviloviae]